MTEIITPTTTKETVFFWGISKEDLQMVLDETLPKKAFKKVIVTKGGFGNFYLHVIVAASDFPINGVSGQFPQRISLMLDKDGFGFIHGAYGGQSIYRKPNIKDPKERFYAMMPIKIPFRKPKNEKEKILKSLVQVCERWTELLKTTENLCYPEHVKEMFD